MDSDLITRHRRASLWVLGGLLAAMLSLVLMSVLGGAGVAPAAPNPPGNNGVIKIDGEPFDIHPDNEPHVGCTFEVDFYGYDEGDLEAEITFESHPPTGPVEVLLTDTVFIGEDDNSGGGSEAGLDAEVEYTLDLSGIEPHPNQGWHVKLTIHAEGSQGADTKFKVFWVEGCVSPPTTSTTSTTSTSTTSTSTSTTSTSTSTTMAPTTSTSTTSTSMAPTSSTSSTTSSTTTSTPSTTSTSSP